MGVVALLLGSAAMMLIVGLGGWGLLVGAKFLLLVFEIAYIAFAYYVSRWNRGVLPVVAGLAVILAVFALVAGPDWFARDKDGFSSATLPSALLGTITLALIPAQMLLVVVSMWAFNQKWNVEEEIHPDDPDWPANRVPPSAEPGPPAPAAPVAG